MPDEQVPLGLAEVWVIWLSDQGPSLQSPNFTCVLSAHKA